MVDVVIAGAGIAGIATAWHLGDEGGVDVVVVDPLPPLTASSNRPEANYRDWWPHPAMAQLADNSLWLIDGLLLDGARIPMDQRGYLYVTTEPERAAAMPAIVEARAAFSGSGAHWLDGENVRANYTHLSPEVIGAIKVPRAGSLDTVALGNALLENAGGKVSVLRGQVIDVAQRGGRVAGVLVNTESGEQRLPADAFVNAAGPFAQPLIDLVEGRLAIETVLRQKAVFDDVAQVVPRNAPFTILIDGQVLPWSDVERREIAASNESGLLHGPLPGGIHVKPDDTAGPNAIKLGWAWDQRPTPAVLRPMCPPTFPRMVLRGATRAIPGLARYLERPLMLAHEGGFYARVPDGRPVIGPLGIDGSFIVGALVGFGAMMAMGAGALASDWVLGGRLAELAQAFNPKRFDDPAYVRELESGRVGTGEL